MRRAFVMGFNGPEGLSPLKFAEDDARRITASLEGPFAGFTVVKPKPESKRQEIHNLLQEQAEECEEDDTFCVFFSGHGVPDEYGELLLVLNDTHKDRLDRTALRAQQVLLHLQTCRARSKLLILDCCRAGGLGDLVDIHIRADNFFVLLASTRLERAREIVSLQGGFLTSNICAALGKERFYEADSDRDNRLSIHELTNWLRSQATEYNAAHPDERVPMPSLISYDRGSFFLATSDGKPHDMSWPDGSRMIVLPVNTDDGHALCIGKHPVLNVQYERFLRESMLRDAAEPAGLPWWRSESQQVPAILARRLKEKRRAPFYPWREQEFKDPDLPVVCVSYHEARSYCSWVNRELDPPGTTILPSSRLWDLAAYGRDTLTRSALPWLRRTNQVHHKSKRPTPADRKGDRTNPWGISDMFGNVWEWTSGERGGNRAVEVTALRVFDFSAIRSDILDAEEVELRGGGFPDNLERTEPALRASRLLRGGNSRYSHLGFRIAARVPMNVLPEEIRKQLSLGIPIAPLSW